MPSIYQREMILNRTLSKLPANQQMRRKPAWTLKNLRLVRLEPQKQIDFKGSDMLRMVVELRM